MNPQLIMLAGPNGAGKSTFYAHFLAELTLPFLNADVVAAETGLDSFEAARVLDATRARMIADRLGFITETVFSDPYGAKLEMLGDAIDAGYDVTLIFICVASPELAIHRVAQRTLRGGHDVPPDRVVSRFERSLENLTKAIEIVPLVELFDNSSAEEPYQHIATIESGLVTKRAKGRMPAWCRGLFAASPRKSSRKSPRKSTRKPRR